MAKKKAPKAKEGESPVIAAVPIQIEPTKEELFTEAKAWAIESGLTEPFLMTGPERVDFPRFGHGYVIVITEQNSAGRVRKTRMGTARFNSKGERSMWTMDGQVVL